MLIALSAIALVGAFLLVIDVKIRRASAAAERNLLLGFSRLLRREQRGAMSRMSIERCWFLRCDACEWVTAREHHFGESIVCGSENSVTIACHGTLRKMLDQEALFAVFALGGWNAVDAVAEARKC